MASRTRTGCLTCRQRKIKCSEETPVCTQCSIANRECTPNSGITFRHQQNPSMNGEPVAKESLKNYLRCKKTFDERTIWVHVPQELTFIHTSNPYEDEDGIINDGMEDTTMLGNTSGPADDGSQLSAELSLSQALYPVCATHVLEALNAVSGQDPYNHAPAPSTMTHPNPQTHTTHSDIASPQHTATPAQGVDHILDNNYFRHHQESIHDLTPLRQLPRALHRLKTRVSTRTVQHEASKLTSRRKPINSLPRQRASPVSARLLRKR